MCPGRMGFREGGCPGMENRKHAVKANLKHERFQYGEATDHNS